MASRPTTIGPKRNNDNAAIVAQVSRVMLSSPQTGLRSECANDLYALWFHRDVTAAR